MQCTRKALVHMNLQLSDLMGMTGQALVRAIVAGERDPNVRTRHRHSHVKASECDIARAMTGNWREEPLFVLGSPRRYSTASPSILQCNAKIEALLAP